MDKDQLQILKERYEREGLTGDLAEAARKGKVSGPNSSTAMAKQKWTELTKSERKAMLGLRKVLDDRKKEESVETI